MKTLLLFITLSLGIGAAALDMTRIECRQMQGFACGDLNGDGRNDLALCSFDKENGGIWIYHQKPDRTFSAEPDRKIRYPAAFDVAIADLDGDGKNDLACANYHPELRIFWGKDNFRSSLQSSSGNQWRPRIAVLPRENTKDSYLLCGAVLHRISPDGKAVNCTITMIPGEKGINQRPLVCDFDLDGKTDVFLSTWPGNATKPGFNLYCSFFTNLNMNRNLININGNDFFYFTNIPTPYQLSYLLADVNTDGAPDLVYSTPEGVYYILQDRFNGFRGGKAELFMKTHYTHVLYDNFNGSEKELAVVSRDQALFFRLPDRKPHRILRFHPLPGTITRLESGDADNDGNAEILLGNTHCLWVIQPR